MATDEEKADAVFRYARAHYAAEDAYNVWVQAARLEQECLEEFDRLCPREDA